MNYEDIVDRQHYDLFIRTKAGNGKSYDWHVSGSVIKCQVAKRTYYSVCLCPHTQMINLFPDRDKLLPESTLAPIFAYKEVFA